MIVPGGRRRIAADLRRGVRAPGVRARADGQADRNPSAVYDAPERETRGREARPGRAGPESENAGYVTFPANEGYAHAPTKHGRVQSDHILFIESGAFHISKPSDLIPEFQGRFPIRVELEPLTKDDFVRILTEPENALTRQYTALLDTEGVKLVFRDDAVAEIARIAAEVNGRTENIGARRLHTVMERLLDQISFDAPEMGGRELTIDAAYVRERLEPILQDQDLSRFIL